MYRERYARQLILPEIGPEGQERLLDSSVLVVGAGGLGTPVLLYLAAAGVGHIGIADDDVVGLSNLQRQVLYTTADVGKPKSQRAREHLEALNPEIRVDSLRERITLDNVHSLAQGFDVIVDGTDNLETRYVLSDAGVALDTPVIYGAVYRFEGQVSVLGGAAGPCYRCMYPMAPAPELMPSCADGGVAGPLPGLIGSIQALEVVKILVGCGDTLEGRLLLVDGLSLDISAIRFRQEPDCPGCGRTDVSGRLPPNATASTSTGSAIVEDGLTITTSELSTLLELGDNTLQLLDIRSKTEHGMGNIGGNQLDLHTLQNGGLAALPAAGTTLVTYCRTGQKSRFAADYLRELGVEDVRSLHGGLLAWKEEIDPELQL